MLGAVILFYSAIVYLAFYMYFKFQERPLDRATIIKQVLLMDLAFVVVLYILAKFFPNNTFGDLFHFSQSVTLLKGGHRYIAELGESCLTGKAPF